MTDPDYLESRRGFNYGRDDVIYYPVVGDGVHTRVIEAGTGIQTLVCLHGTGSRADRWIPAMPGLVRAGFHVFAIDFPGHGFADKHSGMAYNAAGFTRVIAGVLDSLGLTNAIVAGTSLGGHVAARLACDRPDLVSGLVLIGSTGLTEYADEFKRPPESLADASEATVRRKLEFLVSDPSLVTDAWVREESRINSSQGAHEALLRTATFLNDGTNTDLQAGRLNDLKPPKPILLIWGEDDSWIPPQMGRDAAAVLGGSELVLMRGCGHAPYFEDPDQFVDVLKSSTLIASR
jgi:2-hydroxy-6-oxonona-2,4-dienedioate hydrolase